MQQIGRYEIVRELGRGAMGVVYAATDPLIGREVAIKTIRLDSLGDANTRDDLTRRLFREAQSAGILSHPGIITIFDIAESGNDAYIVMEFVAGKTLEDLLAGGVPQPSATLLSVLKQTAEALDYAHSKGIIHRDIKPSNIMISENGTTKIADFGVAKLAASTSLTQAGFVLGTPSYMSPEHAQGREIDGRADQFSLAVVAFRLMTGKLPFDGPTLTAVLSKILWDEPEYESSGLPPFLRPAFEKAFSKNPDHRFEHCADFVLELESCYARHKADLQNKAPVPPVAAPAPKAPPEQEIPATAKEVELPAPPAVEQPGEKRGKAWIWVALIGVAVIAAAVLFFNSGRPTQPPATEAPKAAVNIEEKAAVQTPNEIKPAEITRPATPAPQPSGPVVAPTAVIATQQAPTVLPAKKPSVPARQPAGPTHGTITWMGNLPKNSILVIDGTHASIGTVEGDMLPGQPVIVEVEPREITVRQKPGEENGWRQLMLYSGSAKYSSISILWQLQKK